MCITKEPATVEELIEMINKKPGVEARFATGDELAYLEYQGALVPGEDDFIEAFLGRYKEVFKFEQ